MTQSHPSRLDGKVALVTGGSKGLGREIALGLAAAGADVVVASRKIEGCEHVAAEIRGLGRRALAQACHVGDWSQCELLVERTIEELGRLDILVNNAGIAPVAPSLSETTEALFDKTLAVNLKGPLRLMGLAAPHLRPGSSIINVSSLASLRPSPLTAVYGAAKAGLNALTVAAAKELGPRGIRGQRDRVRLVPHRQLRSVGADARDRGGARGPDPVGSDRGPGGDRRHRVVPGLGRIGLPHRSARPTRRRSGMTGPEPSDLIDPVRLGAWLDEQGLEAGRPLDIAPVRGGASNAMFAVGRGAAHWVLRRPANVAIERANEGMRREFRLLSALTGTDVPHPGVVALCEDHAVLGCTFFLMERVAGVNAFPPPPALDDDRHRAEIAYDMVRSLARLHDVDWQAVGLQDLGHPERFHVDDLAYYEILYNFRLAVLLEGIYQRSLRDPARGAQHPVGERALVNVDRAIELVRSHR